jgi:hypothetical protein
MDPITSDITVIDKEEVAFKEKIKDGPTILIQSDGLDIMMVCPSIVAIKVHSPNLATLISQVFSTFR